MNRKGFTLIELLVVIAIVGILSGIVLAILDEKPSGQISTAASVSVTYPEPTGYVVDTAEVLDAATNAAVGGKLKSIDSIAQVAVVTVKTTQPLTIEDYSIGLADKWKPGYKGKDNGIIFLVATEDRHMRIEVGRGLEGKLTDASAGIILRDIAAPFFKKGDWNGGVLATVDALINKIK